MANKSRKRKERNTSRATYSNPRRRDGQEQTDEDFSPQQELLAVEKAQFNLLIKLTGLSLALSNFPLLQDELAIRLSTELSPYFYFAAQATILALIALCVCKNYRINQIQKGMQSDISNFYAEGGIRRLIKRFFGPGKYEDAIILTNWQRRIKKRGMRTGIQNPEVLNDMLDRFTNILGLLISFFALIFTAISIPVLNTLAAILFLASPFIFSAFTWVYFRTSNQHLVNRIISNEKHYR